MDSTQPALTGLEAFIMLKKVKLQASATSMTSSFVSLNSSGNFSFCEFHNNFIPFTPLNNQNLIICYRFHPRVLYIDIDVHHGDGVEEAFFLTNRVMTVSFHQYGKDFFPGTGHHDSLGDGEGKNYALNIPLHTGITDTMYVDLFKNVIGQVVDKFRPDAIVLQCGADSLNEDQLGLFNLTTRGHGECVNFVLGLGIPLVLLGGGGYTIQNVARCWAYETSVALGKTLDTKLPPNEYSHEYKTPFLHVEANPKMENLNSADYIEKLKLSCYDRLKDLEGAPGVEFQDVCLFLFAKNLQ